MLGAGLGLFGAMMGGGFFCTRVAAAQPIGAAGVPVVDRLSVRVVTDSYHHAFEPSRTVQGVQVQRLGFAVTPGRPPRYTLQNEWGLSLHCETARGTETHQILIDFGYTPETLINNLMLARVDVAALDGLVLSHGHFDHFGGMVGFLQANRGALKAGLPFYLGGEECFCVRELNVPGEGGGFGALDREAMLAAGLAITVVDRPSLIGPHGFSGGRISAASFERVLSPTRMQVGRQGALGCAPEGLSEAKRTLTVVPDDFEHEVSTAFLVRDRGLVVLTSCGHRGVVNSVRSAMAAAGTDRLHAVMGGFHLAPHQPDYQRETLAALKALNPDLLVPMHCSGEAFIAMVQAEMPANFVRSSTGTRFVFGA
jgi:7,8-dihydropterin-6-yl-methyl-4-(beta-D-ribofuranosyl)aminobenzene 5'-phosphate synthase